MIAQMDDRTNEYFDSIYKHAVEAMKANQKRSLAELIIYMWHNTWKELETMSQIFVSGLFTWQLVKLPN